MEHDPWRPLTDADVERLAAIPRYKCPRCGVVVVDEWPCLTAKDAKGCKIAADAGVKPKLRLSHR